MKKIFCFFGIFVTIGIASTAFSANDFTPFTTLDQAKQYCPTKLTFTPNNPKVPNSAGNITGVNGLMFESIPPKTAINPKNKDQSGLIKDSEFRNAEGMYGYISDNVITCLYSYTTFTDIKYALVIRSQ